MCHRRDRDLQCLKLVVQGCKGCKLLTQGGVRNAGSPGSIGSPSRDVAGPGSLGRTRFNVGVSILYVEEAFLETTGPKKKM